MSGIEGWPETCRALGYNYFAGTWTSIAVQLSGEVMCADGESLRTAGTLLVTGDSGGVALGSPTQTSGVIVDRVILNVPLQVGSGASAVWGYSGEPLVGIYVGGKSGTGSAPVPGEGVIASGIGLWMAAGAQKELYVQALDEILVATDSATSGLPVTYLVEGINVA